MAFYDPAVVAVDTLWVLLACAMVLFMTPGLAFFYGGLVRAKNALNTMMMCFAALGVVGVTWVLLGYSLAFASGSWFVGGLDHALLRGVGMQANGSIPHLLFMIYQGTFAIITAALISGSIVERVRFGPFLGFMSLWTLVVYAPVCHWVWGGGWLAELGALDFAGGTVVHVSAAAAACAAAWTLGGRRDHGRQAILPHNLPFVLLGTAILWFGWLGFNAGSALAVSESAVLAFVNTILAPGAALLVWLLLDAAFVRKATAVGGATGIVVGLVAITPAAGFVSPLSALVLGALSAPLSYAAIHVLGRTGLDDSLDVVATHGIGGLVGAVLTGVLADAKWGGAAGALQGNPSQIWIQALGVLATMVYSFLATGALLHGMRIVVALRETDRLEGAGLDLSQHGEVAYSASEGAILIGPESTSESRRPLRTPVPAASRG